MQEEKGGGVSNKGSNIIVTENDKEKGMEVEDRKCENGKGVRVKKVSEMKNRKAIKLKT